MLALTRRIGEDIVMSKDGKEIGRLRVVAIYGDKARISFDFPRWVQIDRAELAEAKAQGPQVTRNGEPIHPKEEHPR